MNNIKEKLIGIWVLDPKSEANKKVLTQLGEVSMQFQEDNKLNYWIQNGNDKQYMFLTYRVEGSELISNQQSAPREERTKFTITDDGRLTLDYSGVKAVFIKRNTLEK